MSNSKKAVTNIGQGAIRSLDVRNIRGSWEYPGFITVVIGEYNLNIGTASGYWGFDVTNDKGETFEIDMCGAVWPFHNDDPQTVNALELADEIEFLVYQVKANRFLTA